MASFNDLPVELILEIVQDLIPFNKFKPILGENASWTTLNAYNDSIMRIEWESVDDFDPLPPSPISIHADILALRLTSSTLNEICTPFVFADLNIIKHIGMEFDDMYDLIIKPYAHHFRTARILLSEPSLSDRNVAQILTASMNLTSLMLYHAHFQNLFMSTTWKFPAGSKEEVEAMAQTNQAIVSALATSSLTSVGIYAHDIVTASFWRRQREPSRALFSLFDMIAENVEATMSLKQLDVVLSAIPEVKYDSIRTKFTSLNSLTIHYALRMGLPKFWESNQIEKWSPDVNLTHLKLRRCANAYAAHIPHIVRHFVSLKVLLMSVCGSGSDQVIHTPPHGWYSAANALWMVRKPLEVFQLEHMDWWEIGVMGEIPTKTLVLANLAGSHFIRAFEGDSDYFPKLRSIIIEPRGRKVGRNGKQFSQKGFDTLQEICERRSLAIVEGASPTSRSPDHCWFEYEG